MNIESTLIATPPKKALPPMVNVGVMRRKQMQGIVDAMPKDKLIIEANELIVRVLAPKGTELISCALIRRRGMPDMWSVRAREGLVLREVTYHKAPAPQDNSHAAKTEPTIQLVDGFGSFNTGVPAHN